MIFVNSSTEYGNNRESERMRIRGKPRATILCNLVDLVLILQGFNSISKYNNFVINRSREKTWD
jgi:hypothetical protein